MREIHAARLTIFNGDIETATQYVSNAEKEFSIPENSINDFQIKIKSSRSGRQFFIRMLKDVIEDRDFSCKGCLITNSANEFAQSDMEISRKINQSFHVYRKLFQRAVETGQRDGSIGKKHTPRLLTDYLLTNINGLRTLVKAGTPKISLNNTARIIVNSLN